MRTRSTAMILSVAALCACVMVDDDEPAESTREQPAASRTDGTRVAVATSGASRDALTPADLARDRNDDAWRRALDRSAAAEGGARAQTGTNDDPSLARPDTDNWSAITPDAVNAATPSAAMAEAAGPAIVRVQILLDRALFSPGQIDGRWGKNTEKAIYWLQHREGLEPTGRLDERTHQRLLQLAGSPQQVIRTHALTAADLEGPFVDIPDDIYQAAELDCMCYESRTEKLAERFHSSPELLARLNQGIDLNTLEPGARLRVPDVQRDTAAQTGQVASLRVSDGGSFVHALDAQNRILYHFPSTLGSSYNPSPRGEWRVASVTEEPWWHYQPALLEDVPDHEPDARIPPGPNSAVGVVWIELSKENYGIHGTSAPETIGHTTSSGCVRLTNWDARFLGRLIGEGTLVRFTETG